MASNNQRAPSAPPPQRWSNDSRKNSKEQILSQVKEMFGSILEPDIILSVVQNCKWKLQPSIDALIMLSENAEVPLNRASRNSARVEKIGAPSSSANIRMSKSLNRDENHHGKPAEYKSNLSQDGSIDRSARTSTANSYLNLNDVELERQKEEFRKFELLKKDLAEKGFIPSKENDNLSRPRYYSEEKNNKIDDGKYQQFGQTWATSNLHSSGKGESAKVYFCSEVENSANAQINPTANQLWANSNVLGTKKSKETNSQLENLFGSKLQFSRDLTDNKIGNKGTIPKKTKNQTQVNVDPAIISTRNTNTSRPLNIKGGQESGKNSIPFNTADYNSADFTHDFEESKAHQQQVAQFDSNYDNETKTRASSGKSTLHKGETESLCGLKVQYRLPGLENSSDDDADVVIEEESSDYPTQIPSLMSINVCQFISSSNQSPTMNTRQEMSTSNDTSPSLSPKHNTYDDKMKSVTSSILNGYKVLVILRGLPGSGKTHLANSIVRSTVGGDGSQFIFSTDDYFVMLGRGVFQYVRSKLTEAHNYNQKRVFSALREGVSPVIVDNTNTQSWEIQPYVVTGVQNGYIIEILEPNTPWARNVNELVRKNTHGVLKDHIKHMADRYEKNITASRLIEQFSLRYTAENCPPQIRRFPFFGEGEEKNEKLKVAGNKNRNRKKKRNNSFIGNSQDTDNYLLSNSDKNMKHADDSTGSKNSDNTLENIVSNALMSENDTLNKSLVDYCIETDSGDEIDSDKVPSAIVENGLDDNTSFDLIDEPDNTEVNNSTTSVKEEISINSQSKIESGTGDLPSTNSASNSTSTTPPSSSSSDSSSSSASSSSSMKKKGAIILHQNLGAIGSERKGSVTAIDCQSFLRNNENTDSALQKNVLSQCWDFTLLVNGMQIHSTVPPSNIDVKLIEEFRNNQKQKETKNETLEPEEFGVIITEIVDDVIPDEFIKDKVSSEDSDATITNILKKMDALEHETTSETEIDPSNLDFETDLAFEEVKSYPEAESEPQGSSSTIGSIFSMMKRTILGINSEEKPTIKDKIKSEESIMKYKYQTNDNSLSENDAFENEMSHREPSALINLDEENPEHNTDSSVTIVGDNLSQKLLEPNLSVSKSSSDKDLCKVSKPVNFSSLEDNKESEFLVEDNLSGKLTEEKTELFNSARNQTSDCVVHSSVETNDSENIKVDNNCEFESEDLPEMNYENLRSEHAAKRLSEINDNQNDDATAIEGNDFFSDILTEAVNRIIAGQETEIRDCRNSFSDGNESESSQTESSRLISRAEEVKNIEENVISNLPNTEEESESKNVTELSPVTIAEKEKTPEIDSELVITPQNFLEPEDKQIDEKRESITLDNDKEKNYSVEECCECCESPTISDTEREIDNEVAEETPCEIVRKSPEIIDNINQVTWKEPPFPIPAETVNNIFENSKKLDIVRKSDSSTNTSDYDFNVLFVGGSPEPEYKTLKTTKRDINSSPSFTRVQEPPLKLMLDKSSMTRVVDILSGEESLESISESEPTKELKKLTEMFPNISRDDVKEIYENLCSYNFNWAVDMILEGVPENVTKYRKIDPPKISIGDRQASGLDSADIESQNSSPRREKIDKLKQSGSSESNDSDYKLQLQSSSPRKKKDRHKVSEEILELKRQIEEKMVINEASYNPHILRVKRWKNGEPDITPDSMDEKLSPQNSIENDEIGVSSPSPKSSESNDEFTEDDIEPEEMMELNLGQEFIKVLENEFGNSEFQFPGGLFPVIQIKKSMAQQIYALWIESMDQQLNAQQEQLDKMIEKDAEYARSLEQEEARSLSEPSVPNLAEIMDMEMALALYHNDLKKKLESETPNDMASRLTRQMLHEMFTDHDPETLNEILKAHNGDFKETVDVLEASTGKVVNRNNTLKKQKSLIDRAKKESIQSDNEGTSSTSIVVVNPEIGQSSILNSTSLTYDAAMEEARISRMEAERQLLLRNENFNKAKEAIRKGNRDVAGYYSQMAKLHAKQREIANATAASAFLAAQDYKMTKEQMRDNTLDLHNLYVAEALQALEVFLDYQISRLNEGTKRSINLYIITGRGARSSNGMSRIKPAVSKKLASKNIRFMDDNPGCLKVVIHRRSGAAG